MIKYMSVNSQVAHTCSMACTCLLRKDLAEAMCPLKNTRHVHTIETVFHEPKLQIGKKTVVIVGSAFTHA